MIQLTHAGDSVRGQNCAEFPAKTDVRAPGVLTPVLTLVTLHTLVYVCKNNTQTLCRYYLQSLHKCASCCIISLFGLSITHFFALHGNKCFCFTSINTVFFVYLQINKRYLTIAVTAVVPNHKSISTSTLEGAWDIDAFVDTVVAVKDALVYV